MFCSSSSSSTRAGQDLWAGGMPCCLPPSEVVAGLWNDNSLLKICSLLEQLSPLPSGKGGGSPGSEASSLSLGGLYFRLGFTKKLQSADSLKGKKLPGTGLLLRSNLVAVFVLIIPGTGVTPRTPKGVLEYHRERKCRQP